MLETIVESVSSTPIRYGAPVVAGVFLLFTYHRARESSRGPAADFWERVRGTVIPVLDRLGKRCSIGYAAYTLGKAEYVGTVDIASEAVEGLLFENGFHRNPLAAYKSLPDGREETGSWAYRESLLARRQTHVMLFPGDDGTTDLYAHAELSAINPLTALDHYRGEGYSPEKGEALVRERLPESAFVDDDECH